MGEQLDYTTLKWVKDEIQESLNQTQQALEAFIEDPSDTTQIRFCATYLHQVYGTLQMVEIYGAALLAEEMEKVANALLNNRIAQKNDAYDVLIRAVIQLPSYLESLERGQPDIPMVLTPLLNDLRASRGEPLLSENAFFSPDLDAPPPPKQSSPNKTYPDASTYARKLRPIFQVSLLGWFREKDTVGSLKKLAAVLRELQNACDGEGARRLWWVAGGIIEALLEDGLEISSSVKMLMGQVDREIKRLIDQGEEALTTEPRSELLKNCLFYIGSSSSNGPRAQALKQTFNLAELLPYGGSMDQARDDMKGSTADILKNVSSVIKDDLLHVKDQLDIFVRDSDRDVAELQPLGENLGRTADTLAMLGLGDLRKVIQDQATSIERLVARGDKPDDNTLMEMASALLYVEASLDNVAESQRNCDEAEAPDLSVHDDGEPSAVLLPPSEQIQITNLVIKEAREVLADVKEGFNTFAVEPTQFEAIEESPAKLVQIQGALAVMNFTRAADLLGAATAFIRNNVLASRAAPDSDQLDTLADAITSIEYFLEAVQEGRSHPEGVLTVAAVSVEQLGHSATNMLTPEAPPPVDAPTGEQELPAIEEQSDDEKAVEFAPAETGEIDEIASSESVATTSPEALMTAAGEEIYPEEEVDEEILEIFIEEADEVLGTMADCLHAWRANLDDQKSLETLRRSYHTIKGSGRLAGAMVMGDFAWTMELLLNRVLENKINPSPALFKVLEHSEIALRGLLAHLKGETQQRPPIRILVAQAEALIGGESLDVSEIFNPAETANIASVLDDNVLVESEEPDDINLDLAHEKSIEPTQVQEFAPAETVVATNESVPEPAFDPVLVDVFRKETATHLETLNRFLRAHGNQLEAALDDDLHRALHTLHGSARMANVTGIAEISDPMDRLIRTLGEKELPLSSESLIVLREFTDSVERQVVDFEQVDIETLDNSALLAHITQLLKQAQAAPSATEETTTSDVDADFDSVEVDDELVAIFLEEANEILGNIDEHMQAWRDGDNETAAIHELQRALHTLKGGARLANFPAIGDLIHALESVLETVDEGHIKADAALPERVQRGIDWLVRATEHVRNNTTLEPDLVLLEQIANFANASEPETTLIETPDTSVADGTDANAEQAPNTIEPDVQAIEEEREPSFDSAATESEHSPAVESLEYPAEREALEESAVAAPGTEEENTEFLTAPLPIEPPAEEAIETSDDVQITDAESPTALENAEQI
ncbi:MAG: hypothetical protein GXP17_00005, partial [Gammaproteobacteria bacterium]|nr:hypothetical protein [Gammaproteobacteria bacterium]